VDHLAKLVEAALFSAAHPLSLADLHALDPNVELDEVQRAVETLRERYEVHDHAFELVELGEGYQLLTRREYADAITSARLVSRPRKLSAAALETLAIIAYRQPVGRSEIEEIRGVAADGVLRSLQERGFIDVVGRGEGLGRPLLYGTTPHFLQLLGLTDLSELPRLDQLSVALRPLGVDMSMGPEGEMEEVGESGAGEPEEPAAVEIEEGLAES
jgi:segregation and condensation protein B